MILPTLEELNTSRTMIETFLGYNHNYRINEAEFYDMKNLTSSHYPLLSPRKKRGVYCTPSNPQGLLAKDALCYVDGTDFVINGYHIDIGLSTDEKDCPKSLISMGSYVIILPDRKWVNTANYSEKALQEDGSYAPAFNRNNGDGDIDAEFTSTAPVKFTLTKIDATEYTPEYNGTKEPEGDIENGALWLDTTSSPNTLKQYSASSGMWVSIATTYIKIESAGIGANFEQYDGVTISGLKDAELKSTVTDSEGKNVVLEGNSTDQIKAIDGSFVVWNRGQDHIVIIGMLDTEQTIINEVTVSRKMPMMDFVIESENRLWGCRYGVANNGEVVNEIYSCKLGDFKNWNCFMGLSTDSYVASCGTDGVFTGAITHLGYPLFFKENCLHKVYGNYPANYQIQTTTCRGVQKGCHNSLDIVNEVLYYKSRSAICAYDGSLPAEISSALGEVSYSDAVAGHIGNKYYISMKDESGLPHLFVYDAAKGLWHKEDNTHADCFCNCRGELYYIDHETKAIKTINGSGTEDTAPVEWMAETGAIGLSMPDKKYISRMTLRMSLELGAKVNFYIQYDSMGGWEHISSVTGVTLRSFAVPIRPKRCDHFRMRIVGCGDAKIYSITKTIEQGSDF